MSINDLSALAAVLLAISLATERLVTIIKTVFPRLADEQKTEAQEVDLTRDKWRRFGIQVIAFLCAWITSAFLAEGGFDLRGNVGITSGEGRLLIPVALLAILASGGSAFWNNVLGYTKAVKDIRIQERAVANLRFHELAEAHGAIAVDGGVTARSPESVIKGPIPDVRHS